MTFWRMGALALAALAAGGAGLVALRQPALLVALGVYTVSLDYLGRIEGSTFTVNNLLKLLLIGAFLVQMLQNGRRLRIPRHLLWFLPFMAFAALSSLYSPGLTRAGFFVVRLGLLWVFAVVVANVIERPWHLVCVLVAMAFTALVVSITAHLQTLNSLTLAGVSMLQKQGPDAGSVRALGTFWDANSLGGFLTLLSLFMVAMVAMPGLRRIWRLVLLAVLFVTFGAILLSYSRSAWLMLVIGMALFWRFADLRPYVKWFFGVGLLGTLYLILFTPYGHLLLDRVLSFTRLSQDHSGRFRWFLALSGLQIWSTGFRWLWGGGFYSFSPLIWAHWYPHITHDMAFHSGTHISHTLLVTLLAEGGLIGVILYALHIFAALKQARRLLRLHLSGIAGIATEACGVIVAVKVIDTFFNPSMYDNLYWLALGLLGALELPGFRAAREESLYQK